ncbi:hypothetical protein CRG98_035349 [Punica granatum]|uniref:Uncharacterized protein n=1 Tax=Punica granatum TaxID=22663 RepID=A0A2I0IJW1_PUNGR|nr:hypothetical protein CRG98_035349 [Punica granatum]
MEEETRIRHLQVADAARASLGLPVLEYIVTDTPLESGQSTGKIKHPGSLLRAVEPLVSQSKVDAVAVMRHFPDDDVGYSNDYRQGMGIDDIAGVEAIISHLVVKEFQLPCAHAPALSPLPLSTSLRPKSVQKRSSDAFALFLSFC